MPRDYVTKILKARVYDVARETPLELAPKLSARLGGEVWLKREDLQPVFSFKLRGGLQQARLAHRGGALARGHRVLGRQPRARGGAGRAPTRRPRPHRHAGDGAAHQGRGGRTARGGGGARRRVLRRREGAGRCAGRGARDGLHPAVRRRARHRRPGHRGDGDRAPARGPLRRDLRRGRRGRAHRGDLRLRQGAVAAHEGHRRRALRHADPLFGPRGRGAGSPWRAWGASPTGGGGEADRGRAVPHRARMRG